MKIEKINFHGMEAVAFEAGGYEAIMIPSVGANVVRLYQKEKGIEILRTPDAGEMETFRQRPHVFGLPLLFPPNRIEDGTYTYNGITYQYPITIPAQHNYHHGIIKSQPFVVTKTIMGEDYVEVEAAFFSNRVNNAIYEHFPHEFECRMNFVLSENGLEQTVTFVNDSETEMPIGVGYHTPINVPFQKEPGEYKMWLTAGEEWDLNERTLPTGDFLPLDAELAVLRNTGMAPTGKPVEKALTNKPFFLEGEEFNGAIIANLATGVKVFYEVDEQFRHWTIWNNGGDAGYMCPEPQTWAINAPNLKLDPEVTGFQVIEPGDAWSATTKLYVK
ncbi:MAG: aldose 1-epimerase [Bacteroidales bacterium]